MKFVITFSIATFVIHFQIMFWQRWFASTVYIKCSNLKYLKALRKSREKKQYKFREKKQHFKKNSIQFIYVYYKGHQPTVHITCNSDFNHLLLLSDIPVLRFALLVVLLHLHLGDTRCAVPNVHHIQHRNINLCRPCQHGNVAATDDDSDVVHFTQNPSIFSPFLIQKIDTMRTKMLHISSLFVSIYKPLLA